MVDGKWLDLQKTDIFVNYKSCWDNPSIIIIMGTIISLLVKLRVSTIQWTDSSVSNNFFTIWY